MKATLLLAGAVAPLALATAAIAADYYPTPADMARLKALEGQWRSDGGYVLQARLAGTQLNLTGHTPESRDLTETLVLHAEPQGVTGGSWERWSGKVKTGAGTTWLRADADRLSGDLRDWSGGTAHHYAACRTPNGSDDARQIDGSAAWLWPQQARFADDGRGVVVTMSIQNVSAEKIGDVFSGFLFALTYRNDRGQSSTSGRVRAHDANGAPVNRLAVDSCATETFEVVFPSVPADARRLEVGRGAGWDLPISPPPAPPPPPPPPPRHEPSSQELAYLRQFEGEWRSMSGYAMRARMSGDRLVAEGLQSGSDTSWESFTIVAEGWGEYKGVWERRSGTNVTIHGTTQFTYAPDRIYGNVTASNGGGSYFACRVSGRGDNSQLVIGTLWIRPSEVRRDGTGAVVSFTAQSVLDAQWAYGLSGLEFIYAGDDGDAVTSSDVRIPDRPAGAALKLDLKPCEAKTFEVRFATLPAKGKLLKLRALGGLYAFTLPLSDPGSPARASSEPSAPLSTPEPAPAASIARAQQSSPPRSKAGFGAGVWQRYGSNWSFKLDEVAPGPDGHWQAIVSVRSENAAKVGLVSNEIEAFLIGEDGQTLSHAGNLYRASVSGPSTALQMVPATIWMMKDDVVRVRLLFPRSAEFRPVRLRLKNNGGNPTIRSFAID